MSDDRRGHLPLSRGDEFMMDIDGRLVGDELYDMPLTLHLEVDSFSDLWAVQDAQHADLGIDELIAWDSGSPLEEHGDVGSVAIYDLGVAPRPQWRPGNAAGMSEAQKRAAGFKQVHAKTNAAFMLCGCDPDNQPCPVASVGQTVHFDRRPSVNCLAMEDNIIFWEVLPAGMPPALLGAAANIFVPRLVEEVVRGVHSVLWAGHRVGPNYDVPLQDAMERLAGCRSARNRYVYVMEVFFRGRNRASTAHLGYELNEGFRDFVVRSGARWPGMVLSREAIGELLQRYGRKGARIRHVEEQE
ncbi:unnamed protein product [Pedinophyceae sp. YPF-701]|nr:unnamed protein product [Pedinophyceae sp. YPF-701]